MASFLAFPPHHLPHLPAAISHPSGLRIRQQESSELTDTPMSWLCPVQSWMVFVDDSFPPVILSWVCHLLTPTLSQESCHLHLSHSSLDHCLFLLQLVGITKDQPDHVAEASLSSVLKLKLLHIETSLIQPLRMLSFPYQNTNGQKGYSKIELYLNKAISADLHFFSSTFPWITAYFTKLLILSHF